MKYSYPAIFSPDGGAYGVYFPDCKGCITWGETMEEAVAMAKDALEGWLLAGIDCDIPAPEPTPISHHRSPDGFVMLITVNIP